MQFQGPLRIRELLINMLMNMLPCFCVKKYINIKYKPNSRSQRNGSASLHFYSSETHKPTSSVTNGVQSRCISQRGEHRFLGIYFPDLLWSVEFEKSKKSTTFKLVCEWWLKLSALQEARSESKNPPILEQPLTWTVHEWSINKYK